MPDVRGTVVFVINVIPSREAIAQYAERKRLIEENISRINGLYSTIQWQPIIYQYRHMGFVQLMACYTACDAALVTPLRDGMNLVAKEFVASRKDLRGTLILSEFAGAAVELTGAIPVNPNDIQLMQDAMLTALTLPENEQEERMKKMQEVIRKNDVENWMNSFLHDAMNENPPLLPANIMSVYDRREVRDAYQKAERRLILLDYDGTLIPYYNKPGEAIPGDLIKNQVDRLGADEKNTIVLLSGRDAETLESWFKNSRINIAAEHGMMYREAGATAWKFPHDLNTGWKENVMSLLNKYLQSYPGSFIEEKKYGISWHFSAVENIDEEAVRLAFSKEMMPLNVQNEFDILYGNKMLEVKSALMNKGLFVAEFLRNSNFDFVLAIGDDVTDEEMFFALNNERHYSIRVGLSQSAARYSVAGVNNVINFLEQLSDTVSEQPQEVT
jgi:trehalose 6-phosphate synthase/phosphatase